MRAFINEAGRSDTRVYAAPPILNQLTIASPIVLHLLKLASQLIDLIPWELVAGVLFIAWRLPEKIKTVHEGIGQRKKNRLLDLEIEQKELQVEQERREIELEREVVGRTNTSFPESTLSDEAIGKVFRRNVLPHLRALGNSGVTEIDASFEENDDNQLRERRQSRSTVTALWPTCPLRPTVPRQPSVDRRSQEPSTAPPY